MIEQVGDRKKTFTEGGRSLWHFTTHFKRNASFSRRRTSRRRNEPKAIQKEEVHQQGDDVVLFMPSMPARPPVNEPQSWRPIHKVNEPEKHPHHNAHLVLGARPMAAKQASSAPQTASPALEGSLYLYRDGAEEMNVSGSQSGSMNTNPTVGSHLPNAYAPSSVRHVLSLFMPS